ncbi:MAG: hypothetical protein RDU14_08810 [Melioribacteraceae bacterium]|nr:hypothetical protein [Melioribacteraceae bacterium]
MNKKSATKFLLFGSLFSLLSIIVIIGCESSRVGPELPRPNPPAPAEQPLTLNGYVKDASNQTAIAGASIKLVKTDGTVLTTLLSNNSGRYSYDATNINESTLNVNASKDGYAFGSRIASLNKASNTAIVSDLLLTKLQVATTTVSVGTGGTASTTNTQSVATQPLTVQVPPNAVSSNIQLTVASLPAGQVPRPTTTNTAVVSAGQFGPSGTQFTQPVTINFPLPYARTAGATFTVMQLNETTGAYTNSGFTATVNADGTSASAQVTHFSILTLQETPTISFNVPSTAIANEFYEKLSSGTISKQLSITNAIALSGSGVVSELWLKDEIASRLLITIGSSEQTLSFSIKALPSQYIRNGVQVGPPGRENESGTWEFRSYYALQTTTTTGNATGPGGWIRVITATSQKWIIISEGWYWIPHNQGSVFFGPY